DSRIPTMPTISRIQPIVWMSTPETVVFTAKASTAPTAARISPTPRPMLPPFWRGPECNRRASVRDSPDFEFVEAPKRMRRGSMVALLGIGLIAGGVATAVALWPTWLPVRASREADRIDFVIWFVIVICIAIFALVAAVMVYAVMRFRVQE